MKLKWISFDIFDEISVSVLVKMSAAPFPPAVRKGLSKYPSRLTGKLTHNYPPTNYQNC